MADPALPSFESLGLRPEIVAAVADAGYEVPTPIQALTVPPLLEGRDVLGQAQTGTGKTAAFALPLLSRIDIENRRPQALVLAPTRELALQVAEAVKTYSSKLKGFHVLPIYGGTPFDGQLRALRRGVHLVVGTPGRVMDHMRRGTLALDALDTLVLDEADEMLRMGFIDDVNWILEHAPEDRRIALFSATMPRAIQSIAEQHLRDPEVIKIEAKSTAAKTVRQRCRIVPHHQKLDVLTRVLETEEYDGMLIFVRTKNGAVELADKLEARGVSTAALNGDVPQRRREELVGQLKSGRIDVLVATDVAARGLDVERLTHVVNYDPPHDTESYVHRIGRTGRAGRSGEAILFITPRERHIVRSIERNTGQRIDRLLLPTTDEVNQQRLARFKESWAAGIDAPGADAFGAIVEELVAEGHDPIALAKAAAAMSQGGQPLLLDRAPKWEQDAIAWANRHPQDRPGPRTDRPPERRERSPRGSHGPEPMVRYRLEVGHEDGVRPGNIVGAVAGESGLSGNRIGHIQIESDHSVIELPKGMPAGTFRRLSGAWVCGKQLALTEIGPAAPGHGHGRRPSRGGPSRDRAERPHRERPRSGTTGKGKRPERSAGGPPRAAAEGPRRRPTPDGDRPYMKRPSPAAGPAKKKRGSKKATPNKGRPKRK